MENLCRLCAAAKQLVEFKCKIDDQYFDIEQKLVTCCSWNSYRSHENLPQNVCMSCFQQLEQCWYFRETIAHAQQKLCTLMQIDVDVDVKPIIDEQSFNDVQVKEENFHDETVEETPIEVSTLKLEHEYENYPNYNENDDDNDADKNLCHYDDNDDVDTKGFELAESTSNEKKSDRTKRKTTATSTTKSIKRNAKEKEKSKRKTGTPKVKKPANNATEFDIQSLLSHEDVNQNGTIKPEKIRAQNFCNWAAIASRCYICNEDFETNSDLWVHFTSTHSNEKIKFICPICPGEMLFLSGRYYRSHIVKSHFPHLNYW